jgi:hypothetical protein
MYLARYDHIVNSACRFRLYLRVYSPDLDLRTLPNEHAQEVECRTLQTLALGSRGSPKREHVPIRIQTR